MLDAGCWMLVLVLMLMLMLMLRDGIVIDCAKTDAHS